MRERLRKRDYRILTSISVDLIYAFLVGIPCHIILAIGIRQEKKVSGRKREAIVSY